MGSRVGLLRGGEGGGQFLSQIIGKELLLGKIGVKMVGVQSLGGQIRIRKGIVFHCLG